MACTAGPLSCAQSLWGLLAGLQWSVLSQYFIGPIKYLFNNLVSGLNPHATHTGFTMLIGSGQVFEKLCWQECMPSALARNTECAGWQRLYL